MTDYPLYKRIGLITGPILFLILLNAPITFISAEADKVIAIAVWMVSWWITEAVSISVTALIPLTFFPLLGIMDVKTVANNYGSPIVFLFFGGFVIALALEKVQLHKRIALAVIRITGTSPNRIVLGFMVATALLSMWISNTATTVVMLPIAASVIHLLMNDEDGFTPKERNFALSIMLGIAFAANVGGMATIIGTPPNTVLAGFLENEYDLQISFVNWMLLGVPFAIIMIFAIYIVLVKWMYPNGISEMEDSKALIDLEISKLGAMSKEEKRVLTVFFVAIFLWIFRTLINKFIPVLALTDVGISMLAAFALFAIPMKFRDGKFPLHWKDTQKLPWGILILFGGGLALASGLSQAGIIAIIGEAVAQNGTLSNIVVASILIIVMLFMTELMSNVALVAIFAPVISGIALGMDASMMHFLIPVTLASSCAFMLPMATPPNAIVFASGHIKIYQMARAGVFLNITAIILLIIFTQVYIPLLFD